jgi:hypothetical protein
METDSRFHTRGMIASEVTLVASSNVIVLHLFLLHFELVLIFYVWYYYIFFVLCEGKGNKFWSKLLETVVPLTPSFPNTLVWPSMEFFTQLFTVGDGLLYCQGGYWSYMWYTTISWVILSLNKLEIDRRHMQTVFTQIYVMIFKEMWI